jgi:hypothetical protein
METNYIVHLNNSFKRFTDDEKATPFHISLYMALFHKWNSAKFRNPISIARDDLMYLSKIGSANTYSKCLKELHTWGYLKYVPSHSYHIGSKIYMYSFDTTKKTTSNKTNDNALDISNNQTNTKTSAQDVRPYKNSNKQIENKLNKENEPAHKNNSEFNSSSTANCNSTLQGEKSAELHPANIEKTSKEKISRKKAQKVLFQKPTAEDLIAYFVEKQQQSAEAEKFYNYFESNGWLVGGKAPMKNWKAAANNWMLNSKKFANEKSNLALGQSHPAGKLHTETNKNYNEPL